MEALNYQAAFNLAIVVIGGLLSLVWHFHRRELKDMRSMFSIETERLQKENEILREKNHELSGQIQRTNLLLAKEYLEKDEFDKFVEQQRNELREFSRQVMDRFDLLFEKLDGKADKRVS